MQDFAVSNERPDEQLFCVNLWRRSGVVREGREGHGDVEPQNFANNATLPIITGRYVMIRLICHDTSSLNDTKSHSFH